MAGYKGERYAYRYDYRRGTRSEKSLKERILNITNEVKKLAFTSIADTINPDRLESMVEAQAAKAIFNDIEVGLDDLFETIEEKDDKRDEQYNELKAILSDIRSESKETNRLLRELINKK